ncbi:hypothetical protein F4859DRAFT_528471 [Xylaria cf. heliscus]|nr:hypothetical protein F4859DRAFT_528471 [Xylaria cf. heliscus]
MENSITDNYAPNWLPYLSEDGDTYVHFDVPCPICSKRLAISEPPDGEDVEVYCIFPCGHAFGHECATTWLSQSANETCPSCRRVLVHGGCGHTVVPLVLKLSDNVNLHKIISNTVVGAEEMPVDCRLCEVFKASLDSNRARDNQPRDDRSRDNQQRDSRQRDNQQRDSRQRDNQQRDSRQRDGQQQSPQFRDVEYGSDSGSSSGSDSGSDSGSSSSSRSSSRSSSGSSDYDDSPPESPGSRPRVRRVFFNVNMGDRTTPLSPEEREAIEEAVVRYAARYLRRR